MPKSRRSAWSTIQSAGWLAPLVAVLILLFIGGAWADSDSSDGSDAAHTLLGFPVSPPLSRAAAPLQVAGDAHTLWVAHPVLWDDSGKKKPGFQLLARASNAQTWTLARDTAGNPNFFSFPRGMAVVSSGTGDSGRCTPYVFSDREGLVASYTTTGSTDRPRLPADHTLLATTGSAHGIFAITAGVPPGSTTQPGDALSFAVSPVAASQPDAAAQPTTASQPGTASAPAPEPQINAYWFHESHWTMLPALGLVGRSPEAPAAGALVGLAQQGRQLVVMWVDPDRPEILHLRHLEYANSKAKWSAATESHFAEPVPGESRLLPVLLDQVLYVFWPRLAPATKALELCGGRVESDASDPLQARNMLPPLSLGLAGEGLDPATDVAIGPAENSIAAIVNRKDNTLTCTVFTAQGKVVSGPTTVVVQPGRRDVALAQNIAILLLIVMLTLSFWQWRQKPGPLKLPQGMSIAKPGRRALAFVIDLAIPYVVICTVFGLWPDGGYLALVSTAAGSILNFQLLLSSPELMSLLGLYLLHVSIGELVFYRSIGKALTGLQVSMIDGKPPTLAATLVRNLIRLPELLLGLLIIYMFLSQSRQRLGDLVARTIVIAHDPPDAVRKPSEE